jgi:hypothetical protein
MPKEQRQEIAAWQKLQKLRDEYIANRKTFKWRKSRKYRKDMWAALEGLFVNLLFTSYSVSIKSRHFRFKKFV